jgi:hypothetical protein
MSPIIETLVSPGLFASKEIYVVAETMDHISAMSGVIKKMTA